MADQAEAGAPGRLRWQRRYDQARIRDADFTTLSGLEVDPVYGPPAGAGRAASSARKELRELKRRLRRSLSRSERARGLLSVRSLGLG